MSLSAEDFGTFATDCDNLKSRYIQAQLDLETANAKLSIASSERFKLERAALILPRNPGWKTDRVQIYFIIYGGEPITDDRVGRLLRTYAQDGVTFQCDDAVFRRDSSTGHHDSGAVLYRYNNSGEMECLMWRQNTFGGHHASPEAKFDPL